MAKTPSYMIDQQKRSGGSISKGVYTGVPGSEEPNPDYMLKTIYDKDENGIVDNSAALGGTPAYVFNQHLKNHQNPHKVTKLQVGLGNVQNISPEDMPVSDPVQDIFNTKEDYLGLPLQNNQILSSTVSGVRHWVDLTAIQEVKWGNIYGLISDQTDLQNELNKKMDRSQEDDYYLKSYFADYSDGVLDAGKPVKLNINGLIDASMINVSMFKYIGPHDPSTGSEYPDTTGLDYGSVWDANPISNPDNPGGDPEYYTFTSGDLSGKQISAGNLMVYGEASWTIVVRQVDPDLYYKLDGSTALTGPFAGGNQQIKNIADGTNNTDGSSVGQVYEAIDNSLVIGRINRRK